MKTYIISEVGVNHNGSMELAKLLIDKAKEVGADAVKFQTFRAENLVRTDAKKADYQIKRTLADESQYEMLKKLELSFDDFIELKRYAETKNIDFLSSPFDIESARFLKRLNLKTFKIPSGEVTNYPLLREIGSYGVKVILSTGMCSLCEVEQALNVLIEAGTKRDEITVLHCNSEYPSPYDDVNLKAMITIKEAFKVNVGYSDHTLGIEVPIAAVALGATVIEKHFTLDKNLPGPDHTASLDPEEFQMLVKAIRNVEKSFGDGIKRPSPSEMRNIKIVRKSIVAKRDIKKGEVFSEDNLTTLRPADGICPMRWKEIIGKVAKRDFKKSEAIEI
ncbi:MULTISPECIES: N-acetylneuraminate synthase [Thermodesulfovibrio]|jgi:N,N'-diacetyllegionaminate synthase|uniref:N-acetylneuraminate synthase n=1 Tax=Thermodesulfovibrio TaxID=28261 RepID=UPI0026114774|nr:N-acetylneuraminate synthase [Thermodesulfovibrio sp.]